jgi:hypothetical protein
MMFKDLYTYWDSLSIQMQIAIAACIGTVADWLFDGDFSFKSFLRLTGSVVVSAAAAVAFVYFVPIMQESPEIVKIAVGGIVGNLTKTVLIRIKKMELKLNIKGSTLSSPPSGDVENREF